MATQNLYTLSTAVFLRHKCQQFYVPDKTVKNSDNFRIKCFSYSKISAILCSLFPVFALFYLILENMSTNGRKFRFPFYVWHSWPRGCHLLNLIIPNSKFGKVQENFEKWNCIVKKYRTVLLEEISLTGLLRLYYEK